MTRTRRHLTTRFWILFAVITVTCSLWGGSPTTAAAETVPQEFYELRVYRIESAAKQELVGNYLEKALLPALSRLGIDRVGVFTRQVDPADHSLVVLIPFPNLDTFVSLNGKLAADTKYTTDAAAHLQEPKSDPAYQRIESRLLKAFAGMPVIEVPDYSKSKKPRLFELRIYESHNEDFARRKVEMFNEGEIQLMRDVKMAPVFYGETLIGPDVPNLIYMLSAENAEDHKAHWKTFVDHPEWKRMTKIEKYKDTVSKITNWFLIPTSYSQL